MPFSGCMLKCLRWRSVIIINAIHFQFSKNMCVFTHIHTHSQIQSKYEYVNNYCISVVEYNITTLSAFPYAWKKSELTELPVS